MAFRDWRIGLIAGLIAAFSPMPALFESRLLLDWLLIPFGAAIMIYLLKTVDSQKRRFPLLTGLFIGLFAITRPNIIAVAPFLIIWLALQKGKKHWLEPVVVVVIGIVIPLLPVFIHNTARGEVVPVAAQGGLNLYLGNNPETDGMTPTLPGYGGDWTIREAWLSAEHETGRSLTVGEMDRFYLKKAIRFARENPGLQLGLLARKIALLSSSAEHGNNGSPHFIRRFSPVLYSPFGWGLLLILAAFGLPFIWKERATRLFLLWLIIYGATIVLFFVNARFRLPLLVGVIPIGAAGIVRAIDAIRKREISLFAWAIPLAVSISFITVLAPGHGFTARGKAESWFGLGSLYMREKNFPAADSAFMNATIAFPNIDRTNLNRGVIAYRRGAPESARAFFLKEIEIGGQVSSAMANIGVLARFRSDTAEAIEYGNKSVEVEPFNIAAYIIYSRSLLEFGLYDSALAVAKNGFELDSLDRRLMLIAGTAALKTGDTTLAENIFSKAAYPSAPAVIRQYELSGIYSVEAAGSVADSVLMGYAFYNLGLIQNSRGKYGAALENLVRSVELVPDLPEAWAGLGTVLERTGNTENALVAFQKALELGGESPELLYNIGLVYARQEKYFEAYETFQQALKLDKDFIPASEKIELLEKLAKENKISLE